MKYGTGITVTLSKEHFTNNQAIIEVYHYANSLQCIKIACTSVHYQDPAFSGALSISASESASSPCPGSEIELSVDTRNLPLLNGKPIAASRIEYQWYEYLENHIRNSWNQCGRGATITVSATTDVAAKYRCQMLIDEDPFGDFLQDVYSNVITINSIQPAKAASIWFVDGKQNKTLAQHKCKGDDGTLQLVADLAESANAAAFQWHHKRASSANWLPVPDGGNEQACTINLADYNETTLFKLAVTNPCGVVTESVNSLELTVGGNSKLTESDIFISKSFDFNNNNPSRITVCVPNDNESTFYWSFKPASNVWSKGNPVILDNNDKGIPLGDDSIFVFKKPAVTDVCPAETVVFHFSASKPISAKKEIYFQRLPPSAFEDPTQGYFIVSQITGGTNKYSIDWYYKTATQKDFELFDLQNLPPPFTLKSAAEGNDNLEHPLRLRMVQCRLAKRG